VSNLAVVQQPEAQPVAHEHERVEDLLRTVVMIGSRAMTVLTVIEDFGVGYTLCNNCGKPPCSGCKANDPADRERWEGHR
jgi:hypothetical protein